MIEYLKLENVADERGEEPAKVARTLVRLGCDLYLHFGPWRESRSGVSFYPEHPTEWMVHNIDPGDHPLTKDSQEAVIKKITHNFSNSCKTSRLMLNICSTIRNHPK